MKIKIVTDSASNMLALDGIDFESVPLRMVTDEKEYVDTADLDVEAMVNDLSTYKGRSGTACPGVGDWLAAFDGYDMIFCITITSNLSGSYNSAMTAKQQYEEENPGKQVYVLDSYTAGPEMKLHIEKIREMVLAGNDYETISKEIEEYKEKNTALVFCLESMRNLANNGRVNPAVATFASLVGIRVVGDATGGKLNPNTKPRGAKKATTEIVANMKKLGYNGGSVYIDHVFNEKAADALKEALVKEYPEVNVVIDKTRGLCSFYAEKGGLMVGFEMK